MLCFRNHEKYFLNDSYTNDTNKLFRIINILLIIYISYFYLDIFIYTFKLNVWHIYIDSITINTHIVL
jgi:hypothetical protein